MNADYVSRIVELLRTGNPLQAKKFEAFLKDCDTVYFERANRFFSQYEKLLSHLGKDFSYSIECYNQMMAEMLYERINFLETGNYSNSSFDDVRIKLYENPTAFEHHMHGLAIAQFVWLDQYQRFSFFAENLLRYKNNTANYLEVGGGHGLYLSEALRQFDGKTAFDLIDISPTSIEMSKVALDTDRVNYILGNIEDGANGKSYDFITIGEVIEHLEEPRKVLINLREILADDGVIFITTPANAPMIDHIYLFRNADEIRALLADSGFIIEQEHSVYAENMEKNKAIKHKVPLMYAAFIRKKL